MCNLIRKHDVSVEAELGFVGYNNSSKSSLTNPDEAKIFIEQTKIDALAVSIEMFTFRNANKIILI